MWLNKSTIPHILDRDTLWDTLINLEPRSIYRWGRNQM